MIFDAVHAYRLERPAPTCSVTKAINAPGAQLFQQRFIKVQARRWRRHRTRLLAVDGLIQLAVGLFVRVQCTAAAACGRWRLRISSTVRSSLNSTEQRVVTRGHGRFDALVIPQQQLRARFQRFGGANMCQNTFIIEHTSDQHLNLAAAGFYVKTDAPDHAGIIKDQQIAGLSLSSRSVKVPCVSAPVGLSSDSKRQLLRSGMG